MANKTKAIVIDEKDNVATALEPIAAGTTVSIDHHGLRTQITVPSPIPAGHKFALCEVKVGEYLLKYGEPIGQAIYRIGAGEHVHVHNVKSHGKKSKGAQ